MPKIPNLNSGVPVTSAADGDYLIIDTGVTTAPITKRNLLKGQLSTKTTTYTLTSADNFILADATSAAFTITLPTAASIAGRVYTIKKIDASANVVTIDANGSETIDGALTAALTIRWESITAVSDGSNWVII